MLMFCHLAIIFLLLVLIGPPQGVNVVQLSNSSTVRVSWQPPPPDVPEELILEYRVRTVKPLWRHPLCGY